jgi:PAS domain-containing protein
MEQQRPVELIVARQLAAALLVPVLLIDESGDTLFYNEPAEKIFGRRFDEIEELPFEDRTSIVAPLNDEGRPLPVDQLPGVIAMRERRPAHVAFHMHGLDGVLRPVSATAVPIESAGGNLLGAIVFVWRRSPAEPGVASE